MRRFVVSVLGVGVLVGCTSSANVEPGKPSNDAAAQDTSAPSDASGGSDTASDDASDATSANDASDASANDATTDAGACPIADDATIDATLSMTVDDNFKLYVNGVLIDDTPRVWSDPQTYAIKLFRNPSRKNVIAVEGINTQQIDGPDRGVVVDMTLAGDAGVSGEIVSDATWKLSTTLETSWFDPAHSDAAWVAATEEGPHGMAPWGNVLGTSNAKWIWSYDSNEPATQKTAQETVYVRKTFYFDKAGTIVGAASACP